MMQASRRGFLAGRFRAGSVPQQRPPWAVEPGEFERRCDGCGDCIGACPTHIIVKGANGVASVDFGAGECTFCGGCVEVCTPGALSRTARMDTLPWQQNMVVGEACLTAQGVECRVCGESCPDGAIRFRPRVGGVAMPQLEVDCCNGCGACIAPCPVRAIIMEAQV